MTTKQDVFITKYLETLNASEAAECAGYANPGQAGSRLLKNDKIRAKIDDFLASLQIDATETLQRLAEIARSDISDFVRIDGRGKLQIDVKKALEAGNAHLIKKVNVRKDGVSIELYDAQAALNTMAKIHGLFAPRKVEGSIDHKHSGEVTHKLTPAETRAAIEDVRVFDAERRGEVM
jgi:phage terminase small subunit